MGMDDKTLRALFGTEKIDEILQAKSSEKQIRAYASGNPVDTPMTAEECKRLCKRCNDLEYHSGYENRVKTYTITDETVDRYGDIVRAKGVLLDNFRKNPVVQFAHNYNELPVGNAIKVWYDKETNSVKALALFFDDRVDPSGRSDTIFRLVQANAMRACSIGFMPLQAHVPKSPEEREKLGLGTMGVEFLKSDLMEFSAVPVPANPSAITDGVVGDWRKSMTKSIKEGNLEKKHLDVLRKYPIVGKDALDILIDKLDAGKVMIEVGYGADVDLVTPGSNRKEIQEVIEKNSSLEAVLRPYPSEHACRLQSPKKYDDFRRGSRKHEEKSYGVIYGHLAKEDKWEDQAYRYPTKDWGEKEAREHCTSHEGELFEPASGVKSVYTWTDVAPISTSSTGVMGTWELQYEPGKEQVRTSPEVRIEKLEVKIDAEEFRKVLVEHMKAFDEQVNVLQARIENLDSVISNGASPDKEGTNVREFMRNILQVKKDGA